MIIKDIKKPVSVAWINDYEYAIGGKNGCIRSQYSENTPIINKKIITEEEVDHIAINKDKTLLGMSLRSKDRGKQVLYNLEQNIVSDIPSNILSDHFHVPIVFSTTHNSLLAYNKGDLIRYDCTNKTIKEDTVQWTPGAYTLPFVDHHPTQNKFLYPSKSKELTIISIEDALTIQTTIICDKSIETAKYSPNGKFIAIKDLNNQYFICTLNTNKDHIDAHALTHDNKKYVACAFHPRESIIALLSTDAHIQYFNYMTRKCIASIKTIPHKESAYIFHFISPIDSSKRLDICSQKLIAALDDECNIIDIPQNNVFNAYKWLLKKEILTELRMYIFSLLILLHSKNMLYFDLNALDQVKTIDNIGNNESNKIESIENSGIIHVTLIGGKDHKESNFEKFNMFGHPGNFSA